jgi:hypothetical protein
MTGRLLFEDGQKFEDFLKEYYTVGFEGYMQYMGMAAKEGPMELEDFKKILTHDESNYYYNVYSSEVTYLGYFSDNIHRLLDKVPITSALDSFKYTTAHNLLREGIGPGGATALFGAQTEPAVSTIDKIVSPIHKITVERDMHSMIHEKIGQSNRGGSDWAWIRDTLTPKAFWDYYDMWLGGYEVAASVHGVDTPATTHIESLDRIISSKAESGTGTTHVSAATDGDIWWDGVGTATMAIDRSSATTWDSQVKLPTVAGTNERYQILEEIDDLMAVGKKYSDNKRYIGITTDAMINLIQDEVGAKGRSLESDVMTEIGINGVNTRAGIKTGTPVQAIRTCGIDVPLFESPMVPTLNTVYTTASAGHLFIVDLDAIEIRVDVPATYLETGFGVEMLHQDYARSRGMLFGVEQLVAKKHAPHLALKWTAV